MRGENVTKKKNEINKKLVSVSENGNFMECLRENVITMKLRKNWTLRILAEKADLSEDTLNTFINGKGKDCNLSTVIKIAKALNISIDELVGEDTLNQDTRECLSICRTLPDNAVYLIRWYIKYIESLNKHNEPNKRYVTVVALECNHHGNLKLTTEYEHVDITHLNEEYRYKVFVGMKVPCEHYMPYYSPYDTLLIANDRLPNANEHCMFRNGNSVYIGRRKVENGIANYYSIRHNKFRFEESEVEELIGYVVGVLNPDGSWAIR